MATLAVDKSRVFEQGGDPKLNGLPSIASDITYAGACVGEATTTGTFQPLASGDNFAGFAIARCDNSAGSASAKNISVRQAGRIHIPVTGASAVTNEGAAVFATDDDTFTLTPSGTRIGRVVRWVTSTTCVVEFDATVKQPKIVITNSITLHATKVIWNLYTAPSACRVTAIKVTPDTVAGGALTATVVKATSTDTPASATTPMHTAAAINLNGTAHTVQAITLSATVADLALVSGERIAVVLSAALTAGSANVTIELELL
jgi:hypothetical protein